MSKFKVGDMVRILHTDYKGVGLDVGTVHEVVRTGYECVFLSGDELYFCDHELELVEKQISTMVKSKMDECTAAGKYQIAVGWAAVLEAVEALEEFTQTPPT